LVAAGFTNVRRYKLGILIWRALGGPTEIELEGILRIFKVDQTAVFLDTRTAEEFGKSSIPEAQPSRPTNSRRPDYIKGCRTTISIRAIVLFERDSGQARTIAARSAKALGTMSLTLPALSSR
jgi:rhodanese-related sulfurtransferase